MGGADMKKRWSEFSDFGEVIDVPSIPMQVEAVFERRRKVPVELYLVLDGERVAYRGMQHGAMQWIPMGGKIRAILDVGGGAAGCA
jgi:hypothetical protein